MVTSSACKSRFPYILNSVLNEGFDSIYWCEDSRSFAIKDEEKFAQLLPLYFKSKNLSAFKRNLSHYGFKKAPTRRGCCIHTASPFSTRAVSVYYHETFRRNDMVALDSMRVVSSKRGVSVDGNQNKEQIIDSQVGVTCAQVCKSQTSEYENHTNGFNTASNSQNFSECCGFKSEMDSVNSSRQRRCSLLATTNNTDSKFCRRDSLKEARRSSLNESCGFKSEMDCVNSSHQRSLLATTNSTDSKICRRGSLKEARRSSLVGGRGESMEIIALLDRISGISLCDQEFQLQGSRVPNRCSTNGIEFSDARWSNLSNHTHRGESMHSLAGVDLSQEAFIRDQETYNCDIENSLFEFQAEFNSRVSVGGNQ